MFGKKKQRIADLENLAAEMYQIFGSMAMDLGIQHTDAFEKVMNKLSAAQNGLHIPETELLPFHAHNIVMDENKIDKPFAYDITFDCYAGDLAVTSNALSIQSLLRIMVSREFEENCEPVITKNDTSYRASVNTSNMRLDATFLENGDFYMDIVSNVNIAMEDIAQFIWDNFKPLNISKSFRFRQAVKND